MWVLSQILTRDLWRVFAKRTAGTTVENGAVTSLYAAASPEALTLGGKACYFQSFAFMVNFIRSSSTWVSTHKSQTQLLKPAVQNLPRRCGTGVKMDTEWSLNFLYVSNHDLLHRCLGIVHGGALTGARMKR